VIRYIPRVPASKNPDESFKVGNRVTVSLPAGRVVEGCCEGHHQSHVHERGLILPVVHLESDAIRVAGARG